MKNSESVSDRNNNELPAFRFSVIYGQFPGGIYSKPDTFTFIIWVGELSRYNWHRIIDFGSRSSTNNILVDIWSDSTIYSYSQS